MDKAERAKVILELREDARRMSKTINVVRHMPGHRSVLEVYLEQLGDIRDEIEYLEAQKLREKR